MFGSWGRCAGVQLTLQFVVGRRLEECGRLLTAFYGAKCIAGLTETRVRRGRLHDGIDVGGVPGYRDSHDGMLIPYLPCGDGDSGSRASAE